MNDPYRILGLAREATLDEVKQAFRRLAKTLHPDARPEAVAGGARFDEVVEAYELLTDPEARRRYDRQHPAPPKAARPAAPPPAADETGLTLALGFVEASLGTRRQVSLPDGRVVELDIPPGTQQGLKIMVEGVAVTIAVERHAVLSRRGAHVHLTLPITVPEALQGAQVQAPTIHGPIRLSIPRGSATGTVLRLKGKGIPATGGAEPSDQLVTLKVVLPPGEETEYAKIVENWGRRRSYVVR